MLRRSFSFVLCLLLAPAAARSAERLDLTFPVACQLGQTCVIQNFVDRDPGPGLYDHRCGALTYDGHDGTDIRVATLSDMRAGVAVLAAADGIVIRARDGAPDVSMRETRVPEDRACGNGILIDHGGGWTSQYCHLKNGSLRALPGRRVLAGVAIGEIGLSGRTEFPHLHFTLRHNGRIVDPQAPEGPPGSCGAGGAPLWRDAPASELYPDAFVLARGFADGPVSAAEVDDGAAVGTRSPGREARALVAYVRAMGLRAGDVQRLTIHAPDGAALAEAAPEPLDRPKAVVLLFAGRKRAGEAPWPAGEYVARYRVLRAGEPVRDEVFSLRL